MVKTSDDWFTRLTGFSERTPDEVRSHLKVDADRLSSRVNGQSYTCGSLNVSSLGQLRREVSKLQSSTGRLQLSEFVGDVGKLHAAPETAGALFQVASQFNLLEMVSPSVTPEQGVGIYEYDLTQGPACAIACGAGTIVRNYFVELDGQVGQSATKQLDCLNEVGRLLGNGESRLWKMQNGYALPASAGLSEVDAKLKAMPEGQLDELRSALMIGIQQDTQVTLPGCSHLVSQAYCSALPVAYSGLPHSQWERFARLILEAAYEATLAAGVLNAKRTGNKDVYLTLLGGGAFGNDPQWILDAMRRACQLYQAADLNVKVVSYQRSNPSVKKLEVEFTT